MRLYAIENAKTLLLFFYYYFIILNILSINTYDYLTNYLLLANVSRKYHLILLNTFILFM